jgi:hypothetical protein
MASRAASSHHSDTIICCQSRIADPGVTNAGSSGDPTRCATAAVSGANSPDLRTRRAQCGPRRVTFQPSSDKAMSKVAPMASVVARSRWKMSTGQLNPRTGP